MNRVDSLPDNQLIERVSSLETQLAELNSYQRLGSHSTLSNRVFSANTFDIQPTSITSGSYRVVLVTFIPSSKAINNLSFVHRLMYTYTSTGVPALTLERFLPANNEQTWKIYVRNDSGSTISSVSIKLYFFVIGSGTFTVV